MKHEVGSRLLPLICFQKTLYKLCRTRIKGHVRLIVVEYWCIASTRLYAYAKHKFPVDRVSKLWNFLLLHVLYFYLRFPRPHLYTRFYKTCFIIRRLLQLSNIWLGGKLSTSKYRLVWLRFMVFNATFNNITVVLLGETGLCSS